MHLQQELAWCPLPVLTPTLAACHRSPNKGKGKGRFSLGSREQHADTCGGRGTTPARDTAPIQATAQLQNMFTSAGVQNQEYEPCAFEHLQNALSWLLRPLLLGLPLTPVALVTVWS